MLQQMSRGLASIVILIIVSISATPQHITTAQGTETTTALITNPVDNAQLFGQVNITGSAGHPTAFDSYTLEYNDLTDPNAPWLLVQPRVRQQVTNNTLGAWNTNVVPDGVYRLRLRIFLQDGQVGGEFIITGLRVVNSAPTPVPTTASTGANVQENTPTPGPSPTSPIQQPPSNSPATPDNIAGFAQPGASESGTGSANTAPTTKTTRINTGRVRSAFCSGAYLAVILFIIMLVYVALRSRLRPYTRRLLWQIQDEFDSDR